MLGFWIIITHLVGAYFTTSEYVGNRATFNTTFAIIASVLYILPFIVFLPVSPLALIVLMVFRFLVVRFALVDYLVWARNLVAPKHKRSERIVSDGRVDTSKATSNQVVSLHIVSIALHCIVAALVIIVL